MYKRVLIVFLITAFLLLGSVACSKGSEIQSFHIGFVTDSESRAPDHFMAAKRLIQEYGDVAAGGRINHVVLEDEILKDSKAVSDKIANLANDPDLELVVVCSGNEGTADAFSRIKELKPRVFCFVVDSMEDDYMIENVADMIVEADITNTGYLIPWVAKQLGATKFVHISFERHLELEILARRRLIMKASCEKHGLQFYDQYAPDPYKVDNKEEVLSYLRTKMKEWIDRYGKDTAFFCTNNLHTDEVVKAVAEYGAIFVQQDLPSPVMGYKEAFGLDFTGMEGNYSAMLKKVEEKLKGKPGDQRMGTWAYSYENATARALVRYGTELKSSDFYKVDLPLFIDCLKEASDGVHWNVFFSYNHLSRTPKQNRVEVYQDTYILNKGPINMSKVMIPNLFDMCEDYLEVKNESTDPREIFKYIDNQE